MSPSGRAFRLEAPEQTNNERDNAAGWSVERERNEPDHGDESATDDADVTGHQRMAALTIISKTAIRVVRRGAA
ncbi:hypothetical protein C0Z20_08175 [Trinickia symbiotica]|uniref:Uncharacterized protein n=1 Tax=Trinickia symbiotica TaxID=863227 RepID=A0A2N7X6A6_9BURK|nr:hypothetical protein C0Z20_08175 [Trinickia symbiotica]